MQIIELDDLSRPELAPFARLTEAQLRNRRDPEQGYLSFLNRWLMR